ncbi:DUF84 family protein [Candidatus Bathyarchaeota archaeon]|nr:DUF84 family protein [Candidatus Bathyarchaeota archaeon]
MIQVFVGSKNPVKIRATRNALDALSHVIGTHEIHSCNVESYAQPFDAEIAKGAIHRATMALDWALDRDDPFVQAISFGVGIEGGIFKLESAYYITACIHVISGAGEFHQAWTAFLECPPKVLYQVKQEGCELGPVVQELRKENNWPWHGGAFGTLTAGTYTRSWAIEHAVLLAFSPFFIKPTARTK